MKMNKTAYIMGIASLAMMGLSQATPVSLAPISDWQANTTWQDIKGTSYTWADANSNGQIDVGETVTFTVDVEKNDWGRHNFDATKVWIDGTPLNAPSSTLYTGTDVWNFSTAASRGNSAYDYLKWTGGDHYYTFDYTFANAGTFDLTASVMCSADLSTLVYDGPFDAPTAADWNAWGENVHGPYGSQVYQGETERYQLQVYPPVPEPGTLALFFLGVSGLAMMGYSRKKKLG